MDGAFIYNKFVTGKHNIGRKSEGMALANLLERGENVVLMEPPKTGKMSLIQQTLYNMRIGGGAFSVAEFSLLGIRSREAFMLRMGSTVLRLHCTTPEEYAAAVGSWLEGTHFVFDPRLFALEDKVLSLSWDSDERDLEAILTLPLRIAKATGKRSFVIISEFQDLGLFDEGEGILRAFDSVLGAFSPEEKRLCSFILSGSQVNAMKEVFGRPNLFRKGFEHLPIGPVETREIIDYIVKGFLVSGKVIERDLLLGVCKLFRQNIWYINHFAAICDSLSKGFIIEATLIEALDMLISIHEPRFVAMMEDLTTYQSGLLKAILEGHQKFSSAEVINKYGLNSSANVKRLKEALCKKEIITFEESEERPVLLDPLFEYWAKKYYFGINE